MRHVTAHISIWNKLGWIGIICYFVFAAAAPEVLTEGNQWIILCLAVLCVTLISLPWKKPFNAIALAGMVIWIIVTRAIPGLEFRQRNPLWLLVGLACVIASCWDPDPESVEDEVELDPDLARSLQAMGRYLAAGQNSTSCANSSSSPAAGCGMRARNAPTPSEASVSAA